MATALVTNLLFSGPPAAAAAAPLALIQCAAKFFNAMLYIAPTKELTCRKVSFSEIHLSHGHPLCFYNGLQMIIPCSDILQCWHDSTNWRAMLMGLVSLHLAAA